MTRIWNRPLSLVIPEPVGEELDRLARDDHRRPREHAALLLIDAIRRAGRDPLADLAITFEAEGQRWFAEADSPSSSIVRRLLLQTRGEAWFQAAARLRAATPTLETSPAEPSSPMG